MDFIFHTFSCPAGGTMRWTASPATHPTLPHARGTVIIFPGLGEWIEKYAETINQLHTRGFNVIIFEWRGQGLSSRLLADPAKGHVPAFDALIDDFDAFFRSHVKTKVPLLVLAHSMGAHLYLRWRCGKGRAEKIEGTIICGVLHEPNTSPFPLPLARWIVKSAIKGGKAEHYAPMQRGYDSAAIPFAANTLTRDEKRYALMMQQLRGNTALKMGGLTYGSLNAIFQSAPRLIQDLKDHPPPEPILFLGAAHDRVVRPEGLRKVAALLPQARTLYFEDAGHELFQETDAVQREIWQAIDAFTAGY